VRLVVVLLCLAALVSPSVARASTASVDPDPSHNLLTYDAAFGETNQVTASFSGGVVTLQDTSASITAGNGCTSVDVHEVTCSMPVKFNRSLEVNLKDMPDTFSVDSGCCWDVSGGRGADALDEQCAGECAGLTGWSGDDLLQGHNLVGGDGDDTLTGTNDGDALDGGSGNDTIDGNGGNDELYGSRGMDALDGDRGADRLYGGFGADELFGGERSGRDQLNGGPGEDRLDGWDGDDRLHGGKGSDLLLGRDGDDRFGARDGFADRIRGGPGADSAWVDKALDSWSAIETLL
jgi:hypothetical protein